MNCRDLRSLAEPYLDSELDVKTSLEIQQHLAACPPCAQWLEAERKAASRLDRELRRGGATPALWERAEQLVRDAAATPRPSARPTGGATPASLGEPWWRDWLWPSPRFYVGVAAVWAVMLTFQFLTLGGSDGTTRTVASPSPEVMRVLADQRRELAQLLGHESPLPAPTGKPEPPQPQSGRPQPTSEPRQGAAPAQSPRLSRA